MDWAEIITRNQAALTRIVAMLIAMVEMGTGNMLALLPPSLHREVLRMLLPVESAVRRLIAMAARGLKVKLPPVRPMPRGLLLAGKGGGQISFQLFDTRQRFSRSSRIHAVARTEPRIHIFSDSPLVPLFHQPRLAENPVPKPIDTIDATRLGRRLAAVRMALENLPRQAKRLARWKARRNQMQKPAFLSPLRPGPPPGHRKEAIEEIDFVLRTCHGLARDALIGDTS